MPGGIDLFIRSSGGDPESWFTPRLEFGETIRVRSPVRPPNHYDVPGAVDPRWTRWSRGRYYYVSLKSPLQLERLDDGASVPVILLRPAFRYMDRFLMACRRLEPFPAGLLRASLAGDPQGLSADTWELFQRLGVRVRP